ncbi:TPA_asm: hypothetical protein G2851_23395 [Salmonella enterica subsp. enterica serovar Enteritidis]|nr:hypothetical protein [Salmonella enterica subsp. enterica serovar Enteritidis]
MKYFEIYTENAVDAWSMASLFDGESACYNIGPDEEMYIVKFITASDEELVKLTLSILDIDYEDIISQEI